MNAIDTTQTVPLEMWDDGTIRVRGTRLLIDMIIGSHNRGQCPEEIYESFPSNDYSVADIYSIIAYYLQNKVRLDKYFAQREKEAEEFWKMIEADPKHVAFRAELQRRKAILNGEKNGKK